MSGQPYSMMMWSMKNDAAITADVSQRVFHGLKPKTSTFPNITFFESSDYRRSYGMESQVFVINSRAKTPESALKLARKVVDLFHGSSSTGIYATQNGFEVSRAFLDTGSGIVPEGNSVYNAPVYITIIYPSKTVS